MSNTYTIMKDKFEEWGSDAQNLIENKDALFEDHTQDDEVSACLFDHINEHSITLELLQLLCKAFSLTTQRLLLDHLPGGGGSFIMFLTPKLSRKQNQYQRPMLVQNVTLLSLIDSFLRSQMLRI